jgi:predicted transcriptional regulator
LCVVPEETGGKPLKLQEITQQLSLEVRAAAENLDRKVTGGYASDLLSCVMAKAQAGNVWVTIQGHPNIVAVASLLDLAGIIVAEGMSIDAATLEKAEEENIPILATSLTAYTVVGELCKLGIPGVD